MADWKAAYKLLAEKHANAPQRRARAILALDNIRANLGELEAMGHRFDLDFDPKWEAAQWPRMFYHRQFAPGGQVFDTEKDKPLVSEGWTASPDFVLTDEEKADLPKPATVEEATKAIKPQPRFIDGKPVDAKQDSPAT